MNECRSDDRKLCYFHPRELVVGICALCLNERLLALASKQGLLHQTHKSLAAKKTPIVLTKVFALTTLLNRLELRSQKPADQYGHSSSSSPEDSFISIKFEENGVASWEKGKTSKMSHNQQRGLSWNDSGWGKDNKMKSLVEHAKPRAALRWRKRIGHLFQLVRWKRSNKGNMCQVGTKHRRSKGLQISG